LYLGGCSKYVSSSRDGRLREVTFTDITSQLTEDASPPAIGVEI